MICGHLSVDATNSSINYYIYCHLVYSVQLACDVYDDRKLIKLLYHR